MAELEQLKAARSAAAAVYEQQAEVVRKMRESADDSGPQFEAAKTLLKDRRKELDEAKKAYDNVAGATTNIFKREETEGLLKRRFFITPSFEIYGGVGGLYDYGPPGTCPRLL